MYPRSQLSKWYVYFVDRLVAVVYALTDRGAVAQASEITGYNVANLTALTSMR